MAASEVTRIFPASRYKLAAVAILCGVAAWVVLLKFDGSRFAYLAAGIVGLISLAHAVLAARGEPVLRLSEQEFEKRSALSSHQFSWTEYYSFRVVEYGIGYMRRGFGTDEVMLNLFEASSSEICEALREWHQRYGAPQPDTALERTHGK